MIIPDAQFKNYLVNNSSINTNSDAEIQVSEAVAYSSGIWVSGSNISSLVGIEAFPNIANLDCSNNALTTLDLSSNASLTQVNANNNQLTQLNMANGSNTSIGLGWFSATNNAALTCIQVDDVNYSTSNWTAIDAQSSYSTDCNYPCDVYIPDANFKSYLLGNSAINTNGDTEIQCSEASAFTGTIDCSGLSIANLTGIEAFTGVTYLSCSANQLTSLDLSANTDLISITCLSNQLTSLQLPSGSNLQFLECAQNNLSVLDLSQNTGLVTMGCSNNQLTSLDVTTNTGLTVIYCIDNQLSAIDVTQNSSLITFLIDNNQLTSLDVSANAALQILDCSENSIASLDLTGNGSLTDLLCANNAILSLDLSQNTSLIELVCSYNQLTTLDVSLNTSLTRVACTDNSLTSLNVANGNNANFNSSLFYAYNNPGLTCIQVDDAAYSTANWTNIDAQTSFDTDCGLGLLEGTNGSMDVSVHPNPVKDALHVQLNQWDVQKVIIVDAAGKVMLEDEISTSMIYDVSGWTEGVYFVQVRTAGQVLNERFIKQ